MARRKVDRLGQALGERGARRGRGDSTDGSAGWGVRSLRRDFDLYAVSRARRWFKTVSARAFQIQNDPGDPAIPGRYADPPHKVVAHVDRFSYPCGRRRNVEVDAVGIPESYRVQVEVLRHVDKKADNIWTGFVADPW